MTSLAEQVDGLFAPWDRPDSPGFALAVVQDGRIVYKRGYGMADLERDVPLTPASIFDIASTSKQFVAMAVLMLANEGKLSLDEDVRTCLPEVPDYGKPITIRHLVHHTSGIRDYVELMMLAGMSWEYDYYEEEIIALIARQKALNFEPGEEYLYSNSGYLLLGQIVQRVSGQSLGDFARERIFESLGMHHTCFYDDFRRIVPNRAIGYTRSSKGGYEIELYKNDLVGNGGVLTSVEDLFLWDQNFYDNRLGGGGPGLIEQMHTPGTLNDGEELDYAFGLIVGEYRGLRMVSHAGGWAGYRAELIRFPDQRFSVICLSNLANTDPTAMAKRVADLYLAGEMQPLEQWAVARAITLSEAELWERTGDFRQPETGMVLRLALQEGKLMVQDPDGREFEIVPLSPERFRAVDALAEIEFTFEHGEAEQPRRIQVLPAGEKAIAFEEVTLVPPGADKLAEYAAAYRSEELQVTYHLRVKDGQLFLKLGYAPEVLLEPTYDDEFSYRGANLRFVRDEAGRVTGLEARIERAQGIWFDKETGRAPSRL